MGRRYKRDMGSGGVSEGAFSWPCWFHLQFKFIHTHQSLTLATVRACAGENCFRGEFDSALKMSSHARLIVQKKVWRMGTGLSYKVPHDYIRYLDYRHVVYYLRYSYDL